MMELINPQGSTKGKRIEIDNKQPKRETSCMKKRSNICVVGVQEGGIKEWEQYFKRPRVNIIQAEAKRSTNFKKDNYKQTNRQITPSRTVLKNQRQRVILKSRFKKMHCPQRNNNKNVSLFNTEDET